MGIGSRTTVLGPAMAVCVALAAPAAAQVKTFDIPAGDASAAIGTFGRQADVQIVAPRRIAQGKRTNPVRGNMTVEQALARLFDGSGLSARQTGPQTYSVVPFRVLPADRQEAGGTGAADPVANDQSGDSETEILVTGTHIVGAPVASPVVQVTERQMREANQRDLGEVIRSIPINYTGGQNPGSRFQTGLTGNTNGTGSSALNLRGLGPDATLTLLNGHRLAYDGLSQAVDVSNIPLDAVASIQIVPDGASAVYGSDAVAGVANVILKRDFSGLTTSARVGGATDGGAFKHAFEAVAGSNWGSGGILVAGQYDYQNALRSSQREYTEYVYRPNTLLDQVQHYGGLITAHQALSHALKFSVDAVYSHRDTRGAEYSDLDYAAPGRILNENYAVSPTLTLGLPHGWSASLNGVVSDNLTHIYSYLIEKSTGDQTTSEVFYRNYAHAAELTLNGKLFSLPGGDAQLALGAGYRHNRILITQRRVDREASNSNYFGFGELSLPLVSQINATPFLHSLVLSGALRHEEYNAFGGVTTPKLGLVYAPSADVDFKLSWGRSFKAPTLNELSQAIGVSVQRARTFGGSGYPADAIILVARGGNRDLLPEHARTLSATAEFHPRAIPGLRLALTYFSIDYTDRVVQPLPPAQRSYLSDPLLARYIQFNPSAADQAATIARDLDGLGNTTGIAYDPAKVVAIANGYLINAAEQKVHGFDLSGSYVIPLKVGDITVFGSGSWLTSEQRNAPGAALAKLAGVNFNPPRFRSRGGVTAHLGGVTLSGFANYVGPLLDQSFSPAAEGDDMVTFDANLLWQVPANGVLADIELSLGVQNIANAKPPYLYPLDDTAVNYDSTNYSPLGRLVSLGLRKKW